MRISGFFKISCFNEGSVQEHEDWYRSAGIPVPGEGIVEEEREEEEN